MLKRNRAISLRRNHIGKPFKGVLAIEHWIGLDDDDVADLCDRGYIPQIGGGTTPTNQTAANPVYFPKAVVVSTDQTINQNDMCWFDAVNFTLKPLTTAAQVAVGATGGFCGCAAGSNVPAVYPDPAAGSPSGKLPGVQVQWGGSVWLQLAANDVVDGPFQAVTAGAGDAQTVTRGLASSSNRVGHVIVPAPTNPRGAAGATPVGETLAGGQRIRVWLERKYPSTCQA